MSIARASFATALLVTTTCTCSALAQESAAPGSSSATQPTPNGPRLALRSGFALPVGSAFYASGSLSDTIAGYVPVRIDLGWRFREHFYAGAFGQLAEIVPNNCPSGATCSGENARMGFMLAAHLFPRRMLDPWLGLGMGYEMHDVTRVVDGFQSRISARGIELLDADIGIDVRAWKGLRVGPVLSMSMGQFTQASVNDVATKDFQTQTHGWVLLGVRGAYDL